jgi:hypothetical protein
VDGEAIAMIRATGFLLGALLMLAVFLFVLGDGIAPSPLPAPVNRAAETTPPTIVSVPAEDASGEAVVDSVVHPVADVADPDEARLPDIDNSGSGVAGNALELDPQSWDESLVAYETSPRNEVMPNDSMPDASMPDDTMKASRYRVWSPFHSKWAAEGFARRLSQATDVPVEVINEQPGNYQVVFSYRDDGERQAMVEQIETVTGLELE